MDVTKYLLRIGYNGPPVPSLDALRALHRCHLLSVPFESLSIHCGEKITLNPQEVYDKIVRRRRGGFCFENNSLFYWLLKELGYQTTILSAHVKNVFTKRYGPPCDHMVLLVDLSGQQWLCDVGFGNSFRMPLLLEPRTEQTQENGVFRLWPDGDMWALECIQEAAELQRSAWASLYKFTLEKRKLADFKSMCEYHQTSPSSLFFCKSFCSLHLPEGMLTYMGLRLITTTYTGTATCQKETRELEEEEIPSILKEKFGIVLIGKLKPKDVEIIPPPPIY
ncbi:arylamine N-acetyltransferase 2-like [Lissotriton helveticus]